MKTITQTNFPGLKKVSQGKVRDIYDLGQHLLIVATDRISAFDVVLPNAIPFKGYVLTQISKFWFDKMEAIMPNHLIATEVKDFPSSCQKYKEDLEGRSMLVKKAKPLPVECIVRGYLTGSGLKDYNKTGHVCGIELPKGLVESSRLESPIFTPSTKAELGAHDENISFENMSDILGSQKAEKVKRLSLEIYTAARKVGEEKGLIIADTKFEMGDYQGGLILIDEALTPDSSRFWPLAGYQPGKSQPSFDKQFVRDYLNTLDWNKQAPGPELPKDVVEKTSRKYLEALKILANQSI
ncbi:phosphoribosylaminoimidazolesuccinocarboxamide synthase [candidate division TA06 bacterium]|uniref:Phosphoribosylaminoimidazole-succinocarboxamide synthase n=1 Tax=candidate division TA06 bacterium TaxID=2250710 RepID=A0A933IAQ0_UNCT6|nr:phosphoribosylaminoimidazolesuccinocarboxamide synthase [candidate division TA06 bacterium]